MNTGIQPSICGTLRKPAQQPQPHWKTAIISPLAAATVSRFSAIAFSGSRSERKARTSSR